MQILAYILHTSEICLLQWRYLHIYLDVYTATFK